MVFNIVNKEVKQVCLVFQVLVPQVNFWYSTDHRLFSNFQEDVLLEGYRKHMMSEDAPAPLTYAEEELEMIKRSEASLTVTFFIILVS